MLRRITERVRAQYERHPYPPVSPFALPRRSPEPEASLALGVSLAKLRAFPTDARILVAGCGSLEALVIARANPSARSVVAVDLSEGSLRVLERRMQLARIAQPFARQAPVELRHADLMTLDDGPFDAVFVSNVLQHVADPIALLERLAAQLAPHGLLRLAVYPRESRLWMRALQEHLRALGLDAQTDEPRRTVRRALASLAPSSPLRMTFEVNPESRTDAGVVDAFLHAHDEPLPLATLAATTRRLGLTLLAERQTASSRSTFVEEVDATLAARIQDPFERLALLDESLELCANPVLWFARADATRATTPAREPSAEVARPGTCRVEGTTLVIEGSLAGLLPAGLPPSCTALRMPNPIGARLAERVRRLDALLTPHGQSAETWLRTLAREVGPRCSAPPEEAPLPGLALSDYDPTALTGLGAAVSDADLAALEQWLGVACGLAVVCDEARMGATLGDDRILKAARGSVLDPVYFTLVPRSA